MHVKTRPVTCTHFCVVLCASAAAKTFEERKITRDFRNLPDFEQVMLGDKYYSASPTILPNVFLRSITWSLTQWIRTTRDGRRKLRSRRPTDWRLSDRQRWPCSRLKTSEPKMPRTRRACNHTCALRCCIPSFVHVFIVTSLSRNETVCNNAKEPLRRKMLK